MSRYTVYLTRRAGKELKDLSGNMRQCVKRAIEELADDPLPSAGKKLNTPEIVHDLRRLRLDKWRIVYVVSESDKTIDIIAVRKRPPYDYGDLGRLLGEAGQT